MAAFVIPGDLSRGATLDGWRLLERLGQGGMGIVFRARHPRSGITGALKVLTPAAASSPEHFARLKREVLALARLNHPCIVRILQAALEHDPPYFVMELLAGGSLTSRIEAAHAKGAPGLDGPELLKLARSLAEALEAIHSERMLHRDIKPANVLYSEHGMPKLADFGIAKQLDRTSLTVVDQVVGTLHYLAPETLRGAGADARSDLYQVGITLFAAATGTLPFKPAELVAVSSGTPLPKLPSLPFSAPPWLHPLLRRLLAEDRQARFQTARELRAALEPVEVSSSRKGWLLAGVAIAAVALLALPRRVPEPPAAPDPAPAVRSGFPRETFETLGPRLQGLEHALETLSRSARPEPTGSPAQFVRPFLEHWRAYASEVFELLREHVFPENRSEEAVSHGGLALCRLFRAWEKAHFAALNSRDARKLPGGRLGNLSLLAEASAVNKHLDTAVAREAKQWLARLPNSLRAHGNPVWSAGLAAMTTLTRRELEAAQAARLQSDVSRLARVAMPAFSAPAGPAFPNEAEEMVDVLLSVLDKAGALTERRRLPQERLEILDRSGPLPVPLELVRYQLASELLHLDREDIPGGLRDTAFFDRQMAGWLELRARLRRLAGKASGRFARVIEERLDEVRQRLELTSHESGQPVPP